MAGQKRSIWVVLLAVVFLTGCLPPPTINVPCDTLELIGAINDANAYPGLTTIVLEANCVYELTAADNFIKDDETYGPSGTSAGTGLPPISTPIIIHGNNATIQRDDSPGTPKFRIFFVTSTGELSLNDLSIRQGWVTGLNIHGGGIFVNGSLLTLEHVLVVENTTNNRGGGIYNDGGTLTINDSNFSFNQAPLGGALANYEGTVVIGGNSTINDNTSSLWAGGIYSWDGDLTVADSEISNNQAADWGGGIFISGDHNTFTLSLDNVLFAGNSAGLRGGAVYIRETNFLIMGSTFTNNQATGSEGRGGALFVFDSGPGTIGGGSLIDGNISGKFGGAMYIYQNYGDSVTIIDSTIQNNSAPFMGGGIFNTGVLSIYNSTISGNTGASQGGGGIKHSGYILTIQNSMISNNNSSIYGGGAEISNCTVNISGTTFQGNSTTGRGGGLFIGCTGTIGGSSIFDGNTANGRGGGFFCGSNCDITFEDGEVTNNHSGTSASLSGGGGIGNDGLLTISSSTISGNTADVTGGGIINNGSLFIHQSTINNNSSSSGVGGIHSEDYLFIQNSTVTSNQGGGETVGGIGVLQDGNIELVNSTIVDNTGPWYGGLWTFGPLSTTIKNSIIALNSPSDCAALQSADVLTILGENIDSDNSCRDFSTIGVGFSITADPLIGPLADNGGPTWTHALLPGSPAIDAATDCTDIAVSPITVDQRFASRPGGLGCDIGAYEDTVLTSATAANETEIPDPTPTPTPEFSSSNRCDLYEEEGIALTMLDITPGTTVQTIFLTIPGGVPGLELVIPGDPGPWQYSATLGSAMAEECTYEGYAERLYCTFELSPAALGTVQELFAFVNDCDEPFFHHQRVSIFDPAPVCTEDLAESECTAVGGELIQVNDLQNICSCPSP
jgi:predicted outer membrane repeat protein